MLQLLSSAEYRKVNLIELLLKNKNKISVKQIAEILHCSERIIDQDVVYIQEHYSFINIHRHKGIITLNIKPEESPNKIYATLLHQSTVFRLLELIFYDSNLHTEDLTEKLDISQATLYRHLSQLKGVLKESFNLTLTTNPYQIRGKERSIRKFYVFFFSEKYLGLDWPENMLTHSIIDTMIVTLRDQAKLLPQSINSHELYAWIFVNITRSELGYLIPTDEYNALFLKKISHYVHLEAFQDMFVQLPKSLQALGNCKAIHQILYPYITEKTLFSHDDGVNQLNPTFDKERMLSVFELIHTLKNEFNIEIDCLSDFALNLYNARHIYECIFNQSFIIYDNRRPFFDYFAEYFTEFNNRLEELIHSSLFNGKHLSKCNLNNMKFIILSHWKDLTKQLMMADPLHIGFITNLSYAFIQFHKHYLENKLPRYCVIDIWKSYPLTSEAIANSPYDLIITNTVLPENVTKPNVYIENIYSPNEMAKVILTINEVKRKQVQGKGAEHRETITTD